MTDPMARAVTAALTLCSQLADARPHAPIRIATAQGTFAAPMTPVGAARVTLHVDTLGVIVIAEVRGATRHLLQYAIPFPCMGCGLPDVRRIESRAYRAFVGAALESALLVAREQTGAAA